jgi:clan AA aspartic protease
MGLTNTILQIKKHLEDDESQELEFLIDSGAGYSLVPEKNLKDLGVVPTRKEKFSLADATIIERKVGDAYFVFKDKGAYSPVIFGQKDDKPLLGVVTLENLGLVFNPYKRELRPMRMLL